MRCDLLQRNMRCDVLQRYKAVNLIKRTCVCNCYWMIIEQILLTMKKKNVISRQSKMIILIRSIDKWRWSVSHSNGKLQNPIHMHTHARMHARTHAHTACATSGTSGTLNPCALTWSCPVGPSLAQAAVENCGCACRPDQEWNKSAKIEKGWLEDVRSHPSKLRIRYGLKQIWTTCKRISFFSGSALSTSFDFIFTELLKCFVWLGVLLVFVLKLKWSSLFADATRSRLVRSLSFLNFLHQIYYM